MKKTYLVLCTLGIIIVVLSLTQITVSNMLSTGGITLDATQTAIADYQRENAILKEQIYSMASLTHIALVAKKEGYVDAVDTAKLVVANEQEASPLAIKP